MVLVEAGLDWKRLEVQKAHNRCHAKDFPVLSDFFSAQRIRIPPSPAVEKQILELDAE
jgi:hypothetical protein